jgi:hypothetical protein
MKQKKNKETGANWMKFQNVYILEFVKNLQFSSSNVYVLEFGSVGYMFKNLDVNQWKKFQL